MNLNGKGKSSSSLFSFQLGNNIAYITADIWYVDMYENIISSLFCPSVSPIQPFQLFFHLTKHSGVIELTQNMYYDLLGH